MVGDVVEAGGTFTLEDCTYEAPEGKQFKGWAVGAVNATPLKQAGDQITITADTIIYAIWEDLPAHTHTDADGQWESDGTYHWHTCSCTEEFDKAAHIDDNGDNKCDICDYAMPAHDPDTPNNPDNTPDNPNNTPDDPSDDTGGLGTGAIIGIVCGSVAVVGIGGFALFWFVIKKKSFADLIAVFKK